MKTPATRKNKANARRTAPAQGALRFQSGWGGKREGAGRKKSKGKTNVPHRKRSRFSKGKPAHVTLRVVDEIANLRRWSVYATFIELLAKCHRGNFRVIEFSLQDRHLHLIVEAFDWKALSNGVRGLEIRLSRRLNSLLGRSGRAIADRYHSRALGSPREVRNAILYVLQNAKKHARPQGGPVDLLSSAPWFGGERSGWAEEGVREKAQTRINEILASRHLRSTAEPCARPQTWLLRVGWRGHGRVSVHERPAS